MAVEIYELTVSGELANQFVQNVFHLDVNNATARTPFAMADDVLRSLVDTIDFPTVFNTLTPLTYAMTSLRCRRVKPSGSPTIILLSDGTSPWQGTRTGTLVAQSNSAVALFYSSTAGGHIGKCFIPGLTEDDCVNGLIAPGFVTDFDANWKNFFNLQFVTDISADNCNWAVYHRAVPGSVHDITDVRLSPKVGTQKRRLNPVY
jgi:hypothetical protein